MGYDIKGLECFGELFMAIGEVKAKISGLTRENKRLRAALDAIETETSHCPDRLSVAQDSLMRVNAIAHKVFYDTEGEG